MKLKIVEERIDEQSRNEIAGMFTKLREIKNSLKGKTKKEVQAAQASIKELKENVRSQHMIGYGADLVFGKNFISLNGGQLADYPTREELLQLKRSYKKEIQLKREKLKRAQVTEKNYRGYAYSLENGVFKKNNAILEIMEDTAQITRARTSKVPYSKIDNFIGVEIECITKCGRELLEEKFVGKKLAGYINVKSDGSIQADNNTHPLEITVMCKESEVADIITRVCKVLSLPSVNAKVNNSCGLHVHLDMRNRQVEESYKKLFHSQSIMLNMLPANRRSDDSSWAAQYCQRNKASTFAEHETNSTRYFNVNTKSYKKFKTLEIRSHSGTVNAEKIINWVNVLTTIVNYTEIPSVTFRSINTFSEFFKVKDEVRLYIEKRTKKFENKKIDTTIDDSDAA